MIDQAITLVNQVWQGFNSLAGVGLLAGIMVTQIVKALDSRIARDMTKAETIAVSMLATMVCFIGLLWFAKQEIRTMATVYNALFAGVAAPLTVGALQKYMGIDIDKLMGGEDPKQPTAGGN